MKKRLLCMLIVLSLFIVSFAPAVNANTGDIIATVAYNYDADCLVVKGTVEHERPGAVLALMANDSKGNMIAVSQTRTFLNDSNKVAFEFSGVSFPATLLSGNVTIVISGQKINTGAPYVLDYKGVDKQFTVLQKINSADESTFDTAFLPNAKELDADIASYTALSEGAKGIMRKLLLAEKYDLPADFMGEENQKKIQKEAVRFSANYKKALAVAQFADIDNRTEFDAWYLGNFGLYGLDKPDATAEVDVTKALPYLKSMKDTTAFLTLITASEALHNMNEIRDYLYESALLSVIAEGHYSEAEKMLNIFSSVFGIANAKLAELSDTEQGKCYSDFSGGVYTTYSEAGEAFNKLVDAALEDNSGSGRGNGGGGGRGGSMIIPTVNPAPGSDNNGNNQQASAQMSFTDMDTAEYAKEAVAHLFERGIVSGKGNGIFEPNSPVTRAEFTKMLILSLAVEADISAAPDFVDVDASDWCAPYVAAAQRIGIAKGNEHGEFLPNEQISRQDMVVMLFRAMKVEENMNYDISFTDSDEISDYARSAVGYMVSKGYVKGIGEGKFGARMNATRAQAAQILYNLMK